MSYAAATRRERCENEREATVENAGAQSGLVLEYLHLNEILLGLSASCSQYVEEPCRG